MKDFKGGMGRAKSSLDRPWNPGTMKGRFDSIVTGPGLIVPLLFDNPGSKAALVIWFWWWPQILIFMSAGCCIFDRRAGKANGCAACYTVSFTAGCRAGWRTQCSIKDMNSCTLVAQQPSRRREVVCTYIVERLLYVFFFWWVTSWPLKAVDLTTPPSLQSRSRWL